MLFASIGTCTYPAKADSNDFISFPSGITLFSPLNSTYNSQQLTLNLFLDSAGSMGYIDSRISMNYSIDGKLNGKVPLTVSNPGVHVITNGVGLVSLPELPEGSHSLTLYLEGFNQKYREPQFLSYVDTVYFSIDLTPLNVSIPSPENKTYTTGASETANLTISAEQEPKSNSEPELFPTVFAVTASAVVVALAGTGLLVYHKHKTRTVSPETFTELSQGSCTRSLLLKTLLTKDW
jgi:hypothetical protein